MESRNNAILGRNSGMRASFGIIDLSILENEWQLLSSILAFPSSSKIFIWLRYPVLIRTLEQATLSLQGFKAKVVFHRIRFQIFLHYNKRLLHRLQYISNALQKQEKKNRSTICVEGEICAVTAKGAYGKLSNRWCGHKTTTNVQKEKENLKTQNLKSHLRFYTKTIEMVISSVGRDRSCYKIAFLIRREWFPRL